MDVLEHAHIRGVCPRIGDDIELRQQQLSIELDIEDSAVLSPA